MLTVGEDLTKECLAVEVATSIPSRRMIRTLEMLFAQHGAPAFLRSDNGPGFIAQAPKTWLAERATQSAYIEPGHPWQNGFRERFHGRLHDEFLAATLFHSVAGARALAEAFRRDYNEEGPPSRSATRRPASSSNGGSTASRPPEGTNHHDGPENGAMSERVTMQNAILRRADDQSPQNATDAVFAGGIPRLPADTPLPDCQLCGSQQTFFFQVDFPVGHPWHAHTVAVFQCTSCQDHEHLIPHVPPGPLRGLRLHAPYLRASQTNHRFLVFPTANGVLRAGYKERVAYVRWEVARDDPGMCRIGRLGDQPDWVLDDESPGLLDGGQAMVFLLQIEQDHTYRILPQAPPQVVIDWIGTGGRGAHPSPEPYYELFVGNALYLFGGPDPEMGLVYALVQSG